MSKTINDSYEFLNSFEEYLLYQADIYIYTGKTYSGALLIKNHGNDKRILLRPFNSLTGGQKLNNFTDKPEFKGQRIDHYLFIAPEFRNNAKSIAKTEETVSLISIDIQNNSLQIDGAIHLDKNIINHIIEFSNSIGFSTSHDFQGLFKNENLVKLQTKINFEKKEIEQKHPKVFISYSQEDKQHNEWVLKLASDLILRGIDAIIDEWNLKDYNDDLHMFMEFGIRESDKVIMVCTPIYAEKANMRKGGVGKENHLITGEFYDNNKSGKFIPIVKKYKTEISECLPSYLKARYVIDFNNHSQYIDQLETLERKIREVPKYKKPPLGKLKELEIKEI